MHAPVRVLALAAIAAGLTSPGAAAETVRVRASEAVAPCARAALAGQPHPVEVSVGSLRIAGREADVLVGASGEVDRALESGRARADTDVEIARIPWVLAVSSGTADLDRVRAAGLSVAVLDGPEGHEARRWAGQLPRERVRLSRDVAVLQASAARLVPLSLAGTGPRTEVKELLPLLAKAAVTTGAEHETAGRLVVEFLGSEPGRTAFAACLSR